MLPLKRCSASSATGFVFKTFSYFVTACSPVWPQGHGPPKQWRVLLGTTDDHVAKEGSKMAEQCNAICQLLGQCLDFYHLDMEESASLLFTWQGERYGIGQLSDYKIV